MPCTLLGACQRSIRHGAALAASIVVLVIVGEAAAVRTVVVARGATQALLVVFTSCQATKSPTFTTQLLRGVAQRGVSVPQECAGATGPATGAMIVAGQRWRRTAAGGRRMVIVFPKLHIFLLVIARELVLPTLVEVVEKIVIVALEWSSTGPRRLTAVPPGAAGQSISTVGVLARRVEHFEARLATLLGALQ